LNDPGAAPRARCRRPGAWWPQRVVLLAYLVAAASPLPTDPVLLSAAERMLALDGRLDLIL